MKVAYCTGFWCTNIGNGFFSLGVEYVLKKILGAENVTVVSDYQTYTCLLYTSCGRGHDLLRRSHRPGTVRCDAGQRQDPLGVGGRGRCGVLCAVPVSYTHLINP